MALDPNATLLSGARQALVVVVPLALVACTRESPSPSPTPSPSPSPSPSAEVRGASASATASSPSSLDEGAAGEDAALAAPTNAPPTGDYRVEVTVVSEDCAVKYKPPAPWNERVFAGAKGKNAKANVRMVAIPPSSATDGPPTNRSDVVFEPRKPWKSSFMPLRQCPTYATAVTAEVKAADTTGFTVVMTVEHGDSSACPGPQPSKCTTKIERKYTLTRMLCKPECTAGILPRAGTFPMDAAPEPDVDCRCK
jgi:hypothetical protein